MRLKKEANCVLADDDDEGYGQEKIPFLSTYPGPFKTISGLVLSFPLPTTDSSVEKKQTVSLIEGWTNYAFAFSLKRHCDLR